jgi:hypothetical protein
MHRSFTLNKKCINTKLLIFITNKYVAIYVKELTMILIFKKFLFHPIAQKLNLLSSTKQLDLLCILCLGYIVFLTRTLFLQNFSETMIDYDSYQYFYTALYIAQNHNLILSPFIDFLTVLSTLSDSENALAFLRNLSIIFSIHLVLIFYLIVRKMFNHIVSFMSTLMALFTPIFLIYSVTLHNDIFALSFGFTSLYFSIRPRRLLHVALAAIFIIISGLTRPDTFIVFIVPFGIGLSHYVSQKINKNFYMVTGILLTIFIILPFVALNSYYNSITRFNPLEKIILFLTYDNIKLVWEKMVQVTYDDTQDKLFLSILVIGMIFFVYYYIKRRPLLRQLNYRSSQSYVTALYLIIMFSINFVILVTYHISYSIINGAIVMSHTITPRYFIGSQILLVYVFVCGFSLLINSIYYSLRGTTIETKRK